MRIELIHPMIVHFPLALLLTGVGFKVVGFFLRDTSLYRYVQVASWMVLSLGVCFAWLAVLSGEFAFDIEKKNLCNEDVLNKHAFLAYTTAFLFTAALLLDFARAWMKKVYPFSNIQELPQKSAFTEPKSRFLRFFRNKAAFAINLLFFLAGTLFLIFTGAFGGTLVFEQGAAVEKCCKTA